jgi:hypothetical protein
MLPIVFGFPSHELYEASKRGEVVLGGCLVGGSLPRHRCTACGEDVLLAEGAETDFAAVEELEAWDEATE